MLSIGDVPPVIGHDRLDDRGARSPAVIAAAMLRRIATLFLVVPSWMNALEDVAVRRRQRVREEVAGGERQRSATPVLSASLRAPRPAQRGRSKTNSAHGRVGLQDRRQERAVRPPPTSTIVRERLPKSYRRRDRARRWRVSCTIELVEDGRGRASSFASTQLSRPFERRDGAAVRHAFGEAAPRRPQTPRRR
jgi:hypothetical protein